LSRYGIERRNFMSLPSAHADGLLEALREFATTIVNPYDLQELLHRLIGHTSALTDSDGAGVMLDGRKALGFASASDGDVVEVEFTQDRIDAGPCHDAFTNNQMTVVDDLEATEKWGEYRDRALQLGFRAVLGVPMNAGDHTIGVLDIYRKAAGPWSPSDLYTAEVLGSMAAGYVLHANQLRAQYDLSDQLQEALESRDVIGQAKGILMAHHHVDANRAFGMLRSFSQDPNIKLRDVAAQLVEAEFNRTGE
jgi:GAF domain-containing protein